VSDYVVGVDPGDSTGVALLRDGRLFLVRQGPPEPMLTLVDVTLGRLTDRAGDAVAVFVERYVGASRRPATRQPTAQEVVGQVRALCRRHGVAFTQQGAADAWACADNALLRRLGWWQRGADVAAADANDANMALRHALLGLMTTRPTLFARLLRGELPPD
jgi:hypothetical protein